MRIIWSRRAIRHLTHVRDYIAQDNPASAAEVARKILESVELLTRHPNLGRQGRIAGTRELVVADTPYVIPYRIHRNRLELMAVFHGRQRWPDLL
ncbi:MAG: type II toxin-antitoxin system RelE/ParE family toxin [Candidatus Korobacteraceae bacterium]